MITTLATSLRLGSRYIIDSVHIGERTRRPYAQLMKLNAILLGLALERLGASGRQVRTADAVLTMLSGATQLAEPAGADIWLPPPIAPQVQPAHEPWSPPAAVDVVRAEQLRPAGDGVVAVLGVRGGGRGPGGTGWRGDHRRAGDERAGRAGSAGPARDRRGVRVPAPDVPAARLAAVASRVRSVSDGTEVAIRVAGGRIVGRADGLGACHAVAAALDHSSG